MIDITESYISTYGLKTPLRIGDQIVLKLSHPEDGWLSSPGLLDDNCFATTDPEHFENCIWEIHVQNQYSAAKEFKEALIASIKTAVTLEDNLSNHKSNHSASKVKRSLQIEKDHFNQLHRAALNEQRLNEKLMGLRRGKPVAFGDPIQLRHVKSQKFLTINPEMLAKEERENIKVYLDPTGDSSSCLGFMRRYRFDKEGQVLTNTSEVLIRVHERGGEYLHAAKVDNLTTATTASTTTAAPSVSRSSEVNCSLEVSYWTVLLYQRVEDVESNTITPGQLVTLQDPESLSCLMIEKSNHKGDKPRIILSPQLHLRDLRPDATTIGTHLLWFVEKAEMTAGGPIALETDRIVFRDLNSGYYMRVDENNGVTTVKPRQEASVFVCQNVQPGQGGGNSSHHFLQEEMTIHLTTSDLWLSTSSNPGTVTTCEASRQKSRAIALSVSSMLFQRLGVQLHVGVQARTVLSTLLKVARDVEHPHHRKGGKAGTDTDPMELTRWLRLAFGVLDNLVLFLAVGEESNNNSGHQREGEHHGPDDEGITATSNKEILSLRQHMLREQGLIDDLLDLLVLTEGTVFDSIQNPVVLMNRESIRNVQKPSPLVAGAGTPKPDTSSAVSSELDQVLALASKSPQIQNRRRASFQLLPNLGLNPNNNSTAANSGGMMAANPQLTPVNVAMTSQPNKLLTTSTTGRRRGSSERTHIAGSSPSHSDRKLSITLATGETPQAFARRISTTLRFSHPDTILGTGSDWEDSENDDEEAEDLLYGKTANTAQEQMQKSASYHLAHRCLKVLLGAIMNNAKNQLYVADRFPVLLTQVQDHRIAVACVEELLKENLSILQTKVRQREIDIFVELLAQYEMSVTFLRLLKSTCACPMGVDATQRMVTHALFGYPNLLEERNTLRLQVMPNPSSLQIRQSISMRFGARPKGPDRFREELAAKQKLMIKLHADYSRLTPVEWKEISLYCPLSSSSSHLEQAVVGYAELKDGLPAISLSWLMTGKQGELSMQSLFGYSDRVPLAVVGSAMHRGSLKTTSKLPQRRSLSTPLLSKSLRRKALLYQQKQQSNLNNTSTTTTTAAKPGLVSISHYRAQVGEYFTQQLYLVADLCLDRNYVAMIILESLYPYDILVAMLKTPAVSSSMKAAVCRILRCLYVDREPQVETKYPRLIRTSLAHQPEAITEAERPQLQTTADHYKFALLQLLISEYMDDTLDLQHCDELSAEMCQLLQALVRFGFYYSLPQILDILTPLVQKLDEKRRVESLQTIATATATAAAEVEEEKEDAEVSTGEHRSLVESLWQWIGWWGLRRRTTERQVTPNDGTETHHHPSTRKGSSAAATAVGRHDQRRPKIQRLFPKVWAVQWQRFSDSFTWLCIVILVVLASVTVAIVQLVSERDFQEFFIATTLFFFIEVLGRYWIHIALTDSTTVSFLSNFSNSLDCLLVCLDIELLIVHMVSTVQPAVVTRSLRILRLLRVIRLVKTLRYLRLRQLRQEQHRVVWTMPKRYIATKKYEAKTMMSMLQILSQFYERIQDQTLDVAIKAFSVWYEAAKADKPCDPLQTFETMLANEAQISRELSVQFDQVILDALMYADGGLTTEAVRLLMVHKSQRDLFFQIVSSIQIVYSPKVAKICETLSAMILELQQLAEMFEVWSDLETNADLEKAQRVQEILQTIHQAVGRPNDNDRSLGIRSLILADEEVQNLLRNLDVMRVFMTLQEALYDGGREALKPQIRMILQACNDLICLFVKNSEMNQSVAFQYLSWFMDRIDDDIHSSKVLRAIVEGNKELIKKCPRGYLSVLVRKIVSEGQKPDYLDLLVGMVENSLLYGSRVMAIEAEICGYLTAREWKKALLLWCGSKEEGNMSTSSNPGAKSDYEERREEMLRVTASLPAEAGGVVLEQHLTPTLQYHLRVLILLTNSQLGPRLHAIYPLSEILTGILDAATVWPIKRELGRLLIGVLKTSIHRAGKSELFWELLRTILHSFEGLPAEIPILSRARNTLLRIQRGEWIELGAGIVSTFFNRYELDPTATVTTEHHKQSSDPRILMRKLSVAIRTLVEYHAGKLGPALTEELQYAVAMIRRQLVVFVEEEDLEEEPALDSVGLTSKLQVLRQQHQRNSVVFADVQQSLYRKQFSTFLQLLRQQSRESKPEIIDFFRSIPSVTTTASVSTTTTTSMGESDVRFEPLLQKLTSHFRTMIHTSDRMLDPAAHETCAWMLKSWRYMIEAELSFRCDQIYSVDDYYEGKLQSAATSELTRLRRVFNDYGVVSLCLDLMTVGIDQVIYLEAMKLLIALLFGSGGIVPIQQTIYRYLVSTDSILFYELLKEMLENVKAFTIKENEVIHQDGEDPRPVVVANLAAIQRIPEDLMVFYLLQGCCEGSFVLIREQIREQRGNTKVINLFELFASLLGMLSKTENICNTFLAGLLLKTILRLVQGPCKGNQEQFVLHTELLISLNRIIREMRPVVTPSSGYSTSSRNALFQYQEKLKESIIDVLLAVIEGHYETSLVFDRVSTTIDVNALHLLIFPQVVEGIGNVTGNGVNARKQSISSPTLAVPVTSVKKHEAGAPSTSLEDRNSIALLSSAQAKYLVLMKTLAKTMDAFDGNPQLFTAQDEITSVEIVFQQQVYVLYFHIPAFIQDMSMEARLQVMESVKKHVTGSREVMLKAFVKEGRKLYRDSTHQQALKKYGLGQLWTMKYYLFRLMFVNAIVLNILCLLYYGSDPDTAPTAAATAMTNSATFLRSGRILLHRLLNTVTSHDSQVSSYLQPFAKDVVFALTALQTLGAVGMVAFFAIVRVPVKYYSTLETNTNHSRIHSVVTAMSDPLVLWYTTYLLIAILALQVHPLFVTFFMLDYVLWDTAAQELLTAVIHPYRQLLAALAIMFIAMNIFAFCLLEMFRYGLIPMPIYTMWESFKLSISYGIRGNYGPEEPSPTEDLQVIQDVFVSFLIITVLRTIFLAVIVDTFDKLREMKSLREAEARNTCFICGTERHEYDRMLPPGVDFSFNDHRNISHNPLYYLYFIMKIWHQPSAKDTSLEIHVRRCLLENDVRWFPTGVLPEIPAMEAIATTEKSLLLTTNDDKDGMNHHPPKGHQGKHHHYRGHGGGHGGGGGEGRHRGGIGQRQTSLTSPSHPENHQTTPMLTQDVAEIVEKVNLMQKQMLKLSKDLSHRPVESPDRHHLTAAVPVTEEARNNSPTGATTRDLRRTAYVPSSDPTKTPFLSPLRVTGDLQEGEETEDGNQSSSEDTYSPTESEAEEEEEDDNDGDDFETKEDPGKAGKDMSLSVPPSPTGKTVGSSSRKSRPQTQNSFSSDHTSSIGQRKKKLLRANQNHSKNSHSHNQLQTAANHEMLQTIMKKLEMMETHLFGDQHHHHHNHKPDKSSASSLAVLKEEEETSSSPPQQTRNASNNSNGHDSTVSRRSPLRPHSATVAGAITRRNLSPESPTPFPLLQGSPLHFLMSKSRPNTSTSSRSARRSHRHSGTNSGTNNRERRQQRKRPKEPGENNPGTTVNNRFSGPPRSLAMKILADHQLNHNTTANNDSK